MSTIKLFEIVGNDFFRPLTGKYQGVFIDCLEIIYESYRTELSYGVDRDILIALLTDYFEKNGSAEIQFEDEQDVFRDSRSKKELLIPGWGLWGGQILSFQVPRGHLNATQASRMAQW